MNRKQRMEKRQKQDHLILGSLACLSLLMIIFAVFSLMFKQASQGATQEKTSERSSSSSFFSVFKPSKPSSKPKTKPAEIPVKSAEAKQAVMDADINTMSNYGLYYDYAHMTLPEVVQAYMTEYGIESDAVAFSYKNLATGETASLNDTQPMTAGSTYKLPLNMLVVDAVTEGKYTLDERFDITDTYYELLSEHNAYMAQFNGAMSIPDMQEYSLVYSENTPAYALADRLGGMEKAYAMFGRYGKGKGELKTFQQEGNKTTTDYYIQVLDYLWKHQDKYADLIHFLEVSFDGEYYKTFWPELRIAQKPGYAHEALNVDAIVHEETPYLIALYTSGLGGSTPESSEINVYGYNQLTQLTYVINEWHRVNMNNAGA